MANPLPLNAITHRYKIVHDCGKKKINLLQNVLPWYWNLTLAIFKGNVKYLSDRYGKTIGIGLSNHA